MPVPPPPLAVHTSRTRKTGIGFVAGCLIAFVGVGILAVVVFAVLAAMLSSGSSTSSTSRVPAGDNTVTAEYATRINAFADKHDMTIEEVLRWNYALGRRGLTLANFDQALTKLGQSRDKALGYHVEPQKRNVGGRRLAVGDPILQQNSTLTEEEESMVKVLKSAGY